MKKLAVWLVSIMMFLTVACAAQPQRNEGVKVRFKAVVQYEQLNEAAQKEARKLGYGPGDFIKIISDDRGNAKMIPK